jgi:hypothetical protein
MRLPRASSQSYCLREGCRPLRKANSQPPHLGHQATDDSSRLLKSLKNEQTRRIFQRETKESEKENTSNDRQKEHKMRAHPLHV